ncbi:hypothetical protein EWH70_02605 [Amycolatopsis suaedae]|uniref:Uncharacterized protein n=2 Tax=Amycolatopsis suaedae TaxID=2510978 RepID=A0A4Q7JE02_9PSEU|nr:hypothetical protein EWH70_02605 [Amycolatopsis suaedae]
MVAAGCSGGDGQVEDSLQVVANPEAARPAPSPERVASPAGTVVPAGSVTALASTAGTLAVALSAPPSVLLYDLADLTKPARPVPLPGPAEQLTADGDGLLAPVPSAGQVLRIAVPTAQVTATPVAGQPVSAARGGDRTLVAVRDRKAVDVVEGGAVRGSVTGQLYSADQVLTSGPNTVVLDRLRTAVFEVDVPGGAVKEGLRAGDGASNAVTDRFGRVLVTDTRAGALLAFSAAPLLLRQRFPVPGGVYGLAYDPRRDLAWVTLTARNEVVGFDVAGGEPVERFRFPTVRQPNSVTVDDRSRVVVGSATGEGIQVIQP